MAKYNGCTPKQVAALRPLMAKAKSIKREMRGIERRLSFELLGWGVPSELRKKLEDLQDDYAKIEKQITAVYNAPQEVREYLNIAYKYTCKAEKLREKYDLP